MRQNTSVSPMLLGAAIALAATMASAVSVLAQETIV